MIAIIKARNITMPTSGSTIIPNKENTIYIAKIANKIPNNVIMNCPPINYFIWILVKSEMH
jgi:hypothetical protein